MLSFLRSFLNPFIGPARPADDHPTEDEDSEPHRTGPHQPNVEDVFAVQRLLVLASGRRLPIELVDEIVDAAHYWPRITVSQEQPLQARGSTARQDVLVLRTPPICSASADRRSDRWPAAPLPEPRLKHPVREIVWTLRSRDQGWSGEAPATHRTYHASYTWFDAAIDRPQYDAASGTDVPSTFAWPQPDFYSPGPSSGARDPQSQEEALRDVGYATLRPPVFPAEEGLEADYRLQTNVQAKRDVTQHDIVWSCRDAAGPDDDAGEELGALGRGARTGDGKFVRSLEVGDCVALWARARFPAWTNHVEAASVAIYFAV